MIDCSQVLRNTHATQSEEACRKMRAHYLHLPYKGVGSWDPWLDTKTMWNIQLHSMQRPIRRNRWVFNQRHQPFLSEQRAQWHIHCRFRLESFWHKLWSKLHYIARKLWRRLQLYSSPVYNETNLE